MNELLYSCINDLDQPTTPTCGVEYGERITTIALAKTNLWSGVPTADQIDTAYWAGSVTILRGIVNGHRVFMGSDEIEVIHKEQVDKVYRIEGRTRKVNAEIARATEKLRRYPVLYCWYITDKNYCFGGYEVYPDFSLIILEGKGVPGYLSFTFDFVDLGIDYSAHDADYPDIGLNDPSDATFDSTSITFDSTIYTFDKT